MIDVRFITSAKVVQTEHNAKRKTCFYLGIVEVQPTWRKQSSANRAQCKEKNTFLSFTYAKTKLVQTKFLNSVCTNQCVIYAI